MRYYKTRQELKLQREQRQTIHAILGEQTVDTILIALQWMENELSLMPDKQMEFGRELTVKASEIEPIKEFLRYG